MIPFDSILVWHDSEPHSGELNMAIDQCLLERESDRSAHQQAPPKKLPILRFYSWRHPSISLGYFESLADAKTQFSEIPENPETQDETPGVDQLHYIRRLTGGGVVDHRSDLTYSLIIPKHHPLANTRGDTSYQLIHQIIANALHLTGTPCSLITEDSNSQSPACFEKPVTHDIIDHNGNKLAGAGQKRNRYGLLHQGSIIGIQDHRHKQWQETFTTLISRQSTAWQPTSQLLNHALTISEKIYASAHWLNKR